jgi:hypothetical protein
MARRTRSAVLGATLLEPLMVRDTVAVETRARSATAWMFICPRAGFLCREPGCSAIQTEDNLPGGIRVMVNLRKKLCA